MTVKVTYEGDGMQVVEMIEEPAGRKIWGIASTRSDTSKGFASNPRHCLAKIPTPLYSEHGRSGEKRHSGEHAEIGYVYAIRLSPEAVKFKAVLASTMAADKAWELITSGEVAAVSISIDTSHPATKQMGTVDGVVYYESWALKELSICRKGANPDAVISGFAEE